MKATSGCVYVLTAFWAIQFTTQTSQSNTENVALNKQYNMGTFYNNRRHAENAANNNTNGEFTLTTNCVHTRYGDYNPWWEVDLGRRYVISNITVWARTGYVSRIANTRILVDDHVCFSFNTSYNSNRDTQFNIVCTKRLVGQIVQLVKNGTGFEKNGDETLNICEVQVFSCKDPFWGDECNNQCGHCLNGEVCDKVNGNCTNCSAGFMLPTCVQECPAGTYSQSCSLNCGERCLDSDCDKVSGLCACKPGWNGSMCDQECSDGSYGLNCTSNCSAGCSNICAKEDGYCICTSEWEGKTCDMRKDQLQINQPQIAVIGGAVGGGVGLIIIVAVIVVCVVSWLKRRSQPLAKGSAAVAADTELTPSHHIGFSAAHEVTTPTARHQEHATSQPRKRQHNNHSHTILTSGSTRIVSPTTSTTAFLAINCIRSSSNHSRRSGRSSRRPL